MQDNAIVWQVLDLDSERTDKPTHPYRSRLFSSVLHALAYCWNVWDDWDEPCMRALELDVDPPEDGYLLFLTNGALRPPKVMTDANLKRAVATIQFELMDQLNSRLEE